MKIMKFPTRSVLMGASLFIAPSLFSQIVTTGDIGTGSLNINAPNYNSIGDQAGPYIVNLTHGTGVTPASSFQTFCIGSQVDYQPGSTYNYQISSVVQPNGLVAPGYVTWGTAYLYSQFLAGALGYGGNTTTPASTPSQLVVNDALQVAIWDLQNQTISGVAFSAPVNNTDVDQFLLDASTAAANAGVSDLSNANGAFGVYALNMYSGNTYAQPELVKLPSAPVPEPGTVFAGLFAGALLLFPFGRNLVNSLRKARAVTTR
jgi:hypothetical protein